MLNRLHIKAKLLLVLFLFQLVIAVASTTAHYQELRASIVQDIDRQLGAIAYGASHILPASFYAKIENASSVTPEEHLRNAEVFTRYAHQTGAKYIYSLMQFGDDIVFTANTTTNELFFDVYESASASLRKVFADGQPWIGDDQDALGAYRSIYLPFKTDNGKTYVVGADIAIHFVHQELRDALWNSLLNGAIRFAILLIVMYVVVDRIVKPLNRLTQFTRELSEKGFALDAATARDIETIGRGRGDEVGSLAQTLRQMVTMLENHIAQLRETTAINERVQSELRIAHTIQMGLLPRVFPAFPERTDFELYAVIEPAEEVGGDLYDYFMMDQQRLFFMIGDVSEKGIPAALFMAIAKTLFKSAARRRNLPINAILSQVNQELVAENPSEMSVAVFAGILDLQTGNVEYSNAGHESPLIYRRNQQQTERLAQPLVGIALGLIEDFVYPVSQITLQPGDTLLLFTDGVSAAMDADHQAFGVERIDACLHRVGHTNPDAIMATLLRTVHEYAGNAPQSDDITALALRYNGGITDLETTVAIRKSGPGGAATP